MVVVGEVVLPCGQQAAVGGGDNGGVGRLALANAPDVACRYMGAQTLHTWEKRDAWAKAAAVSAGCTVRSAFVPDSVETVGYT